MGHNPNAESPCQPKATCLARQIQPDTAAAENTPQTKDVRPVPAATRDDIEKCTQINKKAFPIKGEGLLNESFMRADQDSSISSALSPTMQMPFSSAMRTASS